VTRFDDIGMFWQDFPQPKGRNRIAPVMPEIPETGWEMPKYFPNLSAAKVISLDTETYDPELITRGPGWARGEGHLVGVSIGVDDCRWYFPMRHEIEKNNNLQPENVLAWLSDTLNTERSTKVGANLLYDIGWLRHEGVHVKGPLVDVQYAEALLSETSKVELDVLAAKYLGEKKDTDLLYRWCADYYSGPVSGKQRANIYRTPARLTGPYAESDADLPLRLAKKMYPLLAKENLLDLFEMECKLIPLLLEMRFAGVSVDINKAEQVRDELNKKEKNYLDQLRAMVGFEVNVNASASLAQAFDALGLKYRNTAPTKANPQGQPSFTKAFIKSVTHPIGQIIQEIKTCRKMVGTFIEGYILNSHINGRVYGQFHPLRGMDLGTRSGRFSSSNPNLQNIPSRDPILGPLLRSMFIPDIGHVAWRRYDYSQIEYRFLVHYAVGIGAMEARQRYQTDPKTDYHEMAQHMIKLKTGLQLRRKPVKNVNFGLIYGMGEPKLSKQIGVTLKEGKRLFKAYHEAVPYAKETMKVCADEAQRTGVITTILGRRSRFDLWEPIGWGHNAVALPYERALMSYGQIKRAHTHKALNRRLQGSAADLMKKAMLQCWEDGVFAETGVPRLTVHDELDFSDPGGKDEAFAEMKRIMEQAIPISVPVISDVEIGPDWGHVEGVE
jgi:DNA polymerase I-like protein with 3'-5' exonuclease and polymerase domains